MTAYYFFIDEPDTPFTYLTPSRSVGRLPLPGPLGATPETYLEFAMADLREGGERGLVNAFGNAKRALHLAVDTLLHQYGLLIQNQRAHFPTKLELLDCVGLLPIGILRNLNVERNAVEHDYETPTQRRAEEAVDVARLLLLAIESLVDATPHEAVVGWKGNPLRHMVLQLDPIEGVLSLTRVWAPGQYRRWNGTSTFSGRLRDPFSGELREGVRLASRPSIEIPLTRSHESEWQPIIRKLVECQRGVAPRWYSADRTAGLVTFSITMPYGLDEEESWHDRLDRATRARHDRQRQDVADEPRDDESSP